MVLFAVIALMNGMVNVLNKMVNLQAKLALGTANGTLINYLEATVISLLIVIFTGGRNLANLSYLKSVPPIYFMGGLFGLISMVLILNGMAKAQISYSTVVVLIGQLGTGFLIDSIVTRKIIPIKIVGILLVVAGVVLDKFISNSLKEKSSVKNS
jgi:uncharacterized membrane protein YdcZ (DUF606 family)